MTVLALPLCPNKSEWSLNTVNIRNTSIFNGKDYVKHRYSSWEVTLHFNNLQASDARQLAGWVAGMSDPANTTHLVNTSARLPSDPAANGQIAGSGTQPIFNGSNLTVGDFISIPDQIMTVVSVSPLIVAPGIRHNIPFTDVTYQDAYGTFRLASGGVLQYSPGDFTTTSITLEEVIL